MGAALTEFVIETVIRDSLGAIRANPSLLDDLFSKFNATYFLNQYGQSKIDQIKQYIQNNQIKITHAYSQIPSRMAAISIQMIRSDEDESIQNLGNAFLDEDITITPNTIVDPVIPTAYDAASGRLTIDSSADLSTICPGMLFEDNAGTTFTIISGNSNLVGNKYINIGLQQSPDLGGAGKITSAVDFERTERRMVRLRETIQIGAHAKNDVHLAKYLYYIVYYILKSQQEKLIERGICLDSGFGSMFDREDEIKGENVYSRFIELSFITDFDWDHEKSVIIDCFDLTTKANDPTPLDEATITLTKD